MHHVLAVGNVVRLMRVHLAFGAFVLFRKFLLEVVTGVIGILRVRAVVRTVVVGEYVCTSGVSDSEVIAASWHEQMSRFGYVVIVLYGHVQFRSWQGGITLGGHWWIVVGCARTVAVSRMDVAAATLPLLFLLDLCEKKGGYAKLEL